MKINKIKAACLGLAFLSINISFAQVGSPDELSGSDGVNTITTAVPFLTISPDARHGAMGDAGVATSADNSSIHWNPAKMIWNENNSGLAVNYTPWLRRLVPDIHLSYVSGFLKTKDEKTALGASLKYFSLGQITFTDNEGNVIRPNGTPNEFAIDVAASRKLSDRISGGMALRFIYSNLSLGVSNSQGVDPKPGLAVAADVFAYYQNDDITLLKRDATIAFGGGISNIGNKMSYSNTDRSDFIPINLRIGPRVTLHLDKYNDVSFHFDLNKLMVPTPPKYVKNTTTGERVIMAGEDPERSVASGMFASFFDAPGAEVRDSKGDPVLGPDGKYEIEGGSVLREELREIYGGFGAEYTYNKVFAARAGYFAEHSKKGNRKYLTFGIGLKYNVLGFDFSYLVPFYVGKQQSIANSPLQNTLRFTLSFDFAKLKKNNEVIEE